jgi:hypothetical protein
MFKEYIINALVLSSEGRTFEHDFNITINPDELMNAATFDKYAHVRPSWKIIKINHIQEITIEYKYKTIAAFNINDAE